MKLPNAFSPEVMAELARPYSPVDPRAAQIGDDVTAKWYVIEVASRDVEAELVKRRFGIYVPEEDETIIRRGRKIDRRVLMFPGYVFIFLWETDANWHRMVSIRGVTTVLGTLSDDQVDKIRYCENCARPVLLQNFEVEQDVIPKKRRKRFRKAKRKIVVVQDEVVSVRAGGWSRLEDAMMSLDSEGRNQALRNMLSVSS